MTREIGKKLVNLIANDDFTQLAEMLSGDVIFTAATPEDTWHGEGVEDALLELRGFFSPDEVIAKIVSIEHYDLPGRSRVSYRLQGNEKEFGLFEYEHQAYYQTTDSKFSRLRILCSGLYVPQK